MCLSCHSCGEGGLPLSAAAAAPNARLPALSPSSPSPPPPTACDLVVMMMMMMMILLLLLLLMLLLAVVPAPHRTTPFAYAICYMPSCLFHHPRQGHPSSS